MNRSHSVDERSLIDEFLPEYQHGERHRIDIAAPPQQVYPVVRSLDTRGSGVIRTLFRLRGMPRSSLTLEGLERDGFVILADRPDDELVLGSIGRFWTPAGDLKRVTPSQFRSFEAVGYAKAVWNFTLSELASSSTRLTTETRVFCPDGPSRRRFRLYWAVIGPFSALIRKEMLLSIKRTVETESPTGRIP